MKATDVEIRTYVNTRMVWYARTGLIPAQSLEDYGKFTTRQ